MESSLVFGGLLLTMLFLCVWSETRIVSPWASCQRLRPGVVLIRRAVGARLQRRILRRCFAYGDGSGKFYEGDKLNAWRQGRARCYDAVEAVDPFLAAVCRALVARARAHDAQVSSADVDHTHLLLLYYTARGIGWHRDDGPNDGESDEAVVSLSLGAACDFAIKEAPKSPPTTVRLETGDALLFGGPNKRIMHAVTSIDLDSCPTCLRDLRPPRLRDASDSFRLNLTWRHAPELRGLEATERFYHFGAATRLYLDTERKHGTDVARRQAEERRLRRRAASALCRTPGGC